MEQKKQPKFFYGWVVVFTIFCLQGSATGILNNTMSVFIKPVSEALGVSRSTFYLYNTFGMIAGIFASPFWGEFFRNRRFKLWMIFGCLVCGGSVFAYSMCTHIYQFYAIAMVRSAFQGMLMGVPISRTLSFWFIEKRGLATGIALSGSGFAGGVMTPIVSRTIELYGWRAGYRQLGILFFLISGPILLFLYRERPEDMGLKPLGWIEEIHGKPRESATGIKSGISRAQAFRSKTYWCYVGSLFLTQGCVMSTSNNVVNHLTDIGYTPAFAASIFSILLFMLIPGKTVLGYIYDKLGMAKGCAIIYFIIGTAPSVLALTGLFRGSTWMPYVFAMWFGFGYSILSMQHPYFSPKLFGEKEFTRVFGICGPFSSIGNAIIVNSVNKGQEAIGSYVPLFFANTGGLAVALALMLAAIRFAPIETEKFDKEDGILPASAETLAVAVGS